MCTCSLLSFQSSRAMDQSVKKTNQAKKKKWSVTNRFKYVFLLGAFCSTSLFLMSIPRTNYIKFTHSVNRKDKFYSDKDFKTSKGCNFPSLHPMDKSVEEFVKQPDVQLCSDPEELPLEYNRTHIWVKSNFLEQINNQSASCCYRHFFRPVTIMDINERNVDDRVAYAGCRNFTDIINVNPNHEFVQVNCTMDTSSTIRQFFLFNPKKTFVSHDSKELLDNSSSLNVLVLGIDAVSRLNMYRTMPKTVKYLKNKGAVDLAGYNKVGDNTFPNLIPMLLGISVEELNKTCLPYKHAKFDNCPFLWEWYKQAGYYTALGEDSAWLGTFNYLRAGFSSTPTDYYLHTFIHEAEAYSKKRNSDFGSSSFCVNEKYFFKILLDYVQNLTVTLNSNKLFGFFWEVTMSHDDLNYPMVMDNDYVSFFRELEKSGYLNNTVIFLVSDHGIRWGGIRYTKQGRIEERMPFVFVLAPPSFRKKYSQAFKNLQINSNRLTTPFDVHATLFDLINLQNLDNHKIKSRKKAPYGNKRGISLFLPIPLNRTCEMAHISDHWCTCLKEHSIGKTSREAKDAAFHLIKYLNYLLKNYPECAPLEVGSVMEATELIVGKPDKDESGIWHEYQVTVKTSPGEGVFEGTIRKSSNLQWTVSGSVSRLNRYANQSACIEDNLLKLYCFCS